MVQTASVVETLKVGHSGIEVDTKTIQTTGDRLESAPLEQISGKGVFEKEIDEAIVNGEVDFAVHSMKDVPADQPKELVIAAVPKRASPNDVLISRIVPKFVDLPQGATVGTSSPRRIAEILSVRPDLKVQPIRGNIDTRLRKLDSGNYDAVILAEAGITRLGLESRLVERLPIEDFTPAPGQGFLAVVSRSDREDVLRILQSANDPVSQAESVAERAFMNEVGGGCKIPLGTYAQANGQTIKLLGSVISPEGSKRINVREQGDSKFPETVGRAAAQRILRMGAGEILKSWKS